MKKLADLGREFDQHFESQRRSVPKVYVYGNEIRRNSRQWIKAAIDRDDEMKTKSNSAIIEAWNNLGDLNVPKTFAAFEGFDSAQEIYEASLSCRFFEIILEGGNSINAIDWELFNPNAFKMEPQPILFGMIEAGSEVSRIINRYIIKNKLSRKERRTLRENYLNIARELNDFLDHFSEVTPAVIDAYNRHGFKQAFKSKLNQLRGAIEFQEKFVLDAIEHED